MTFLKAILAYLLTLLKMPSKRLPQPISEPDEPETVPESETQPEAEITPKNVYDAAYARLGQHLTLDPSVPKDVGCVEAVSTVLSDAGFAMPPHGIAGVNALIEWMLDNGWTETDEAIPGAVITAHQPNEANTNYAHAGVCGKTWIMSNDSQTGRFAANYSYGGWTTYFGTVHGSITRYFIPAV